MKNVQKLFENGKNHILILGVIVSFFLVFRQDHSPALPLQQVKAKTLEVINISPTADLTTGNLANANFLTAFFSFIVSKSKENDSNKNCCDKYAIEKSPVIEVFSTCK